MHVKTFRSPMQLKEDGPEGSFRAIFSRFNVIDHDGDVTLPDAFTEGEKVRISYWGHRWQDLPVGRGEIHFDDEKAWVDGQFFLGTDGGEQTYLTVKELGDLQEWSYGFDIDEISFGEFEDQDVAFLRALTVHEVSPVLLGAGIDTGTESIKDLQSRARKATSDSAGDDDGQTGDGEPSGTPVHVFATAIEIGLLEQTLLED